MKTKNLPGFSALNSIGAVNYVQYLSQTGHGNQVENRVTPAHRILCDRIECRLERDASGRLRRVCTPGCRMVEC